MESSISPEAGVDLDLAQTFQASQNVCWEEPTGPPTPGESWVIRLVDSWWCHQEIERRNLKPLLFLKGNQRIYTKIPQLNSTSTETLFARPVCAYKV